MVSNKQGPASGQGGLTGDLPGAQDSRGMTVVRKKTPAKKAAPAPPVPRHERKQDTRERIRAAVFARFTTLGFDETTTKAVAARAGVAAGTVFVHADDKTDLLCLV